MRRVHHTFRGKLALAVVCLALLASTAGAAAYSGFTSTTPSSTSILGAGRVSLTTNAGGDDPFAGLPALVPGADPVSRCVQVTYTGTIAATVLVSALHSDGVLADNVGAVITRGRIPDPLPGGFDCAGFVADTDAQAVVFRGPVSTLPAAAAPEADDLAWSPGEVRVYEIALSLYDYVPDAAASTAFSLTLTWSAENR